MFAWASFGSELAQGWCDGAQKTGDPGKIQESPWGTQGSEQLTSTMERAEEGRSHGAGEGKELGSKEAQEDARRRGEERQQGSVKVIQGTSKEMKKTRKKAGTTCDGRGKNPDSSGEKGPAGRPSHVPGGTWLSQVRNYVYGSCFDLLS
ncbi:hypothetical protein NDU88_004314 [Pleurodeles waltl]|uniref:Uncharacterized protein n=1 Tax=Pleurodeles waltl TaxID=8319 RepID=A0AAV7UHU4_PLEWA|nr:hypothetical protein NDU88_004314 [Pleurodeles waltl]